MVEPTVTMGLDGVWRTRRTYKNGRFPPYSMYADLSELMAYRGRDSPVKYNQEEVSITFNDSKGVAIKVFIVLEELPWLVHALSAVSR